MNVSKEEIQKVQDEMGMWKEDRTVEKCDKQMLSVILRELRRKWHECYREEGGLPMGTTFCSSCKEIPI